MIPEAAKSRYLETLRELVLLESPTHDKVATDRLADYLARTLPEVGWKVERIAQLAVGDQLLARQPGQGSSTLLLCHYDTVWPIGTLEVMPYRQDGDRLFGPGVLDMKAGLAMAMFAPEVVRQSGRRLCGPLTLLITSDEEAGSRYSQALIEAQAKEHDRVLVLEPSREDGALKVGRKGVGGFTVRLIGRSAHAGNNPQDGASALRELAHLLLFVESLSDEVAQTSVNLTVARGGTVSNVIAEEAVAEVDWRVLTLAEAERVMQAVHSYRPRDPRVQVTIQGGLNRPPLEPTPANRQLLAEAQRHGAGLGLTLMGAVVGGGSDGNFTSALGIPTLDGLGAVGEGPHARHEQIRLTETLQRLALLSAILS